MQLGARDEFRLYLLMYAKRIGAEGLKGKVEELLNSLLGGLGGLLQDKKGRKEDGKGWFSRDDLLCGWDRRELLKGVVMILGKQQTLERWRWMSTNRLPKANSVSCSASLFSTQEFSISRRTITGLKARISSKMGIWTWKHRSPTSTWTLSRGVMA
jgi:hypothetical protein